MRPRAKEAKPHAKRQSVPAACGFVLVDEVAADLQHLEPRSTDAEDPRPNTRGRRSVGSQLQKLRSGSHGLQPHSDGLHRTQLLVASTLLAMAPTEHRVRTLLYTWCIKSRVKERPQSKGHAK